MRKKKVIKNVIFTLLLQFITVICGFIVPRMIMKSFGSSVNGLVSSITQFLSYIVFLEAGIGPVIKSLLYKPIAEKDKNKIQAILKAAEKFFKTISKIFIVYIISLSVFFPIIMKGQFEILYTFSLVIIISISTFMEYYMGMVYKLFLQAEQKKYIVSQIQIVTTIINTIMIVILIKIGANIQLVKLISTCIFVSRPIIINIYVRKKYDIDLKNVTQIEKIEQKWDGLAQHVASIVHTNTDVSILTILSKNISEVSVYSVYYMVVKGIKQIMEAFTGGIEDSFGDMIARGEQDKLCDNFNIYELVYYTISTILYVSTLVLIIPFVKVYTLGINDVNYIRYTFAYLLIIGEFIWVIRQPYNNLIKAAGHFKQTKNGAWLEAIINLILSIILVGKYGLVGVAIGTLISITIRTIEIIIYTSKNILKRTMENNIKRAIVLILQFVLILIILRLTNLLINESIDSYFYLFKYAIQVFAVISTIVIGSNILIYKKDVKELIKKMKRKGKKEDKNENDKN